ncbi:RNase A-like domain-containing protein [Achromobacter seleniivolatilans]|uniref:RNase A-like domain-containing protein n=1 Tax=Achromobacter seleniivolatilans TaxID=3047478 RepID=A0ABY9M2W2_9BURK|nr:RNase A-like domain-containing protein [Achromobacter sp. R39]WMD21368.1 RNase A-like domain-containing protein [Achromobacter sp. R39]
MDEESSISIVLTPVQLAAILQGESVNSETTLSNRLWGGLKLAGGVAEMIGGAALCAVPEPTGATKVGCVVLGGHGIDTASTGLQEVWTGKQISSLTDRGFAELATRLGATPGSGLAVGIAAEIGVPIGFAGAIKAARVSSIVAGRISLSRHEAAVAGGIGGHTLGKHVGKTRAYLEARLRANPNLPAASTFHSVADAEHAVNALMRREAARVEDWAAMTSGSQKLTLYGSVSGDIGVVLNRGASEVVKGTELVLVLKRQAYNGMPYFILTAYLD